MSSDLIKVVEDIGGCVFHFAARSGSFRDWSENGNDGAVTGGILSRSGYLTRDTGGIDIPFHSSLNLGGGEECSTVTFLSDIFQPGGYASPRLFDQTGGLLSYITGGTSWAFQIAAVGSILVDLAGHSYRCFGNSWTDGNKPEFFGDGVFIGLGSATLSSSDTASKIVIANNTGGGIRPLHNMLASTLFFSKALTVTEHAALYAALRGQVWPQKRFARARSMATVGPNETGLVAGYNMRAVGGKVIDQSPNGNDGDIVGPVTERAPLGYGMRFDGAGDRIDVPYADSPDAFSVSGWFKATTRGGNNFGRLVAKGAQVFDLYISNSDSTLALAYHNGTAPQSASFLNAYQKNIWTHVAVTYASGSITLYSNGTPIGAVIDSLVLNASTVLIGNSPVVDRSFDGLICCFRAHNRALTADEVKAEYNAGADTVLFKTDWGARETVAPVTTGLISTTPAEVLSGSFDLITTDIEGEQCKALICRTAGAVALPASLFHVDPTGAARGGFEFWAYREVGGFYRFLIASNIQGVQGTSGVDGYEAQITNANEVGIVEITNGVGSIINRSSGFDAPGGWAKINVTVSNAGVFSLYYNDVLVDMTGGSGTNPITDTTHTESRYIVWGAAQIGQMLAWADRRGEHSFVKTLGAHVP